MAVEKSGWFGWRKAVNQPRLQAKQKSGRTRIRSNIRGNLPVAIQTLGDLITIDNNKPTKLNASQIKDRLESSVEHIADSLNTSFNKLDSENSNLGDILSHIGKFLTKHQSTLRGGDSTQKDVINVALKDLEDITSAIGLIGKFNEFGGNTGLPELEEKSKKFLEGFSGHWDRQNVEVSSWTGKISRVSNNQSNATEGLQAWGKYFADFRAYNTSNHSHAFNAKRARTFSELIYSWKPLQETNTTKVKIRTFLEAAQTKMDQPTQTPEKKARQYLEQAQICTNQRVYSFAREQSKKGIEECLNMENLDYTLLTRLMIENAIANNNGDETAAINENFASLANRSSNEVVLTKELVQFCQKVDINLNDLLDKPQFNASDFKKQFESTIKKRFLSSNKQKNLRKLKKYRAAIFGGNVDTRPRFNGEEKKSMWPTMPRYKDSKYLTTDLPTPEYVKSIHTPGSNVKKLTRDLQAKLRTEKRAEIKAKVQDIFEALKEMEGVTTTENAITIGTKTFTIDLSDDGKTLTLSNPDYDDVYNLNKVKDCDDAINNLNFDYKQMKQNDNTK